MIFCDNCGRENADVSRICRFCGVVLPAPYQSLPPQSTQQRLRAAAVG